MKDLCASDGEGLISLDQALSHIRDSLSAIEDSEHISLSHAPGRVLARPAISTLPIPAQAVSSMDGYAFASQDIPKNQVFTLQMAGVSWAGRPYQKALKPGECVRIFTGAVVPDGADSVIMQEQVIKQDNAIQFPANCPTKRFIRSAGSDIQQGQTLLKQYRRLSAIDCALLASIGAYSIPVLRKIRIAFFSTGDELQSPGQPLQAGQIYNSNRFVLQGLLNNPALSVADLGILADDKTLIDNTLRQASRDFDVMITTGGASVGDADYIAEILAESGQVNFWKLAIKPGKPLAFGRFGDCWFFGLPGNPVSTVVTFQKLVQPALDRLLAQPVRQPLRLSATCLGEIKKVPGRLEFQRGQFFQQDNGEFQVKPLTGQDSHQLAALSQANCYIVLAADCQGVKAGERVIIEPFDITLHDYPNDKIYNSSP